MKKTEITAHAGCMGTSADSIESVKAAVSIKADICEVDVSALYDGTPVLKHDRVLPEDTILIRLSDVFEYVKGKDIFLNLDIKDISSIKETHWLVDIYGIADRVFLTGISEEDAALLKDSESNFKYYLNHNLQPSSAELDYENYLDNLIKRIISLGCIGLNSHYKFCTEMAVQKLHESGLLISVWTVDDVSDMKLLIDMGVDNITTKRPDLILDILDK